MSRRNSPFVGAVCALLTVVLLPELGLAGAFTLGSFSSETDLGLNVYQPFSIALHADSTGAYIVGNATFTDRTTDTTGVFTSGSPGFHTWTGGSAPTFANPALNGAVDTVRVAHSVFSQTIPGTLTGLTPAQPYRLQFMIYDGDFSRIPGTATFTAGSDSFVYPIVPPTSTGMGRYVNYYFTPSTTSLSFLITPTPGPGGSNSTFVLSAINLLAPEPGAAGLLTLIGCAGFSTIGSRRRKRV